MHTKGTRELSFPVADMTCQACALSVERALASVPGVEEAEVNYGSRMARVLRDPERAAGDDIAAAVRRAGYRTPEGIDGEVDLESQLAFSEEAELGAQLRLRRDATLAVLFGAGTVGLTLAGASPWFVLLAAAVVVVGAGWRVLGNGWRAALRLAPDMNTLIALGSFAAFLAGAASILGAAELVGAYGPLLRAAALTMTFTLIGRFLEGRARERAGDAVRGLLDLSPPTARVLRRGEEREVPLAEVRPGNLVLVRPGERVPVDGEILSGASELDESLLTGESVAVERGPGDPIFAGTLNGLGALSVKTTHVGPECALGRIAAAVRAAQGSRPESQRIADRISAVFVPGVLGLAVLTLALWLALGTTSEAIARCVAVLVVACPCALGLATPTAILVAGGRGAREGCLFRDAAALERLARVDTAVLDKTGTLTLGEPELVRIVRIGGGETNENDLLTYAAAVERGSEQPLARAVLAAASARGLALPPATDVRAEPGRGIRGVVSGRPIRLASPRAVAEEAELPAELLAPLAEAGETPVCLLIDGVPAALLGFVDALRPTSKAAIRELEQLGLTVHVVSGDHAAPVEAVVRSLGVSAHRAETDPEGKAAYVRELASGGHRTLMAGDGINDAVALSVANVGIAFGGGADVALEAADGALLTDDPARLPVLIRLARRTLVTIRTNLLWAFVYNLVALPVAAGVLSPWTAWTLPPHWGAASMAGSSLFVVLNSLRLRWVRLGPD